MCMSAYAPASVRREGHGQTPQQIQRGQWPDCGDLRRDGYRIISSFAPLSPSRELERGCVGMSGLQMQKYVRQRKSTLKLRTTEYRQINRTQNSVFTACYLCFLAAFTLFYRNTTKLERSAIPVFIEIAK